MTLFVFFVILLSCQKQNARIVLFNGIALNGWHVDVPEMDKNPEARNPFIVRDGMLVSLGEPNGHLITDSVYRELPSGS